jgi:hypothetical protein
MMTRIDPIEFDQVPDDYNVMIEYGGGMTLRLHRRSIGDGPFRDGNVRIGVDYTVFVDGNERKIGRILCERNDCIPCHPGRAIGCTSPPPPPRAPRPAVGGVGEELVLTIPPGAIGQQVLLFANAADAQATLRGALRGNAMPDGTQFHVFDVTRVPPRFDSHGLLGKVIAIPVTVRP